jgi:RNA polymerase sigma factor (sigma-70 family)
MLANVISHSSLLRRHFGVQQCRSVSAPSGNLTIELTMDDFDLLHRYVNHRSEEAFRHLVERHLGMVFRTAQRALNDSALAEEVTQNAFIMLAEKGNSLQHPQVIAGWLYHTAKNLTMNVIRTEQRRRTREKTAAEMEVINASTQANPFLEQLEPAMAELSNEERDALVLRFFEERSFKEVGSEMGVSEDAARMRVNRALEELRKVFGRRGMAMSASVLIGGLTATSATAVPTALASVITAAVAKSFTGGTVVTAVSWLNAKSIAAIAAAMIFASGGTTLIYRQQLAQQRAASTRLAEQNQQLIQDRQVALATAEAKGQELITAQINQSELLKLRAEVTRLKAQSNTRRTSGKEPATASIQLEPQPAASPGTRLTKEMLSFAGYDTPEATLQSLNYGFVSGRLDVLTNAFGPKEREDMQTAGGAENLKKAQEMMAQALVAYQIHGRKVLAGDKVEINYSMEMTPEFVKSGHIPPSFIIKMTKIDEAWTIDDSPDPTPKDWDKDGEIQWFGR